MLDAQIAADILERAATVGGAVVDTAIAEEILQCEVTNEQMSAVKYRERPQKTQASIQNGRRTIVAYDAYGSGDGRQKAGAIVRWELLGELIRARRHVDRGPMPAAVRRNDGGNQLI